MTKKGKGYEPAELKPDKFHGVGPFQVETGELETPKDKDTYTDVFGKVLCDEAGRNPDIVAITAAMADGTGLTRFRQMYPDRFFDVGIAEEHGVTFAAGLVMTLIGVLISPYVLQWVGTPSDVMESSVLYLRIYFLGILSVMVYNMGSGILRAVGDSRNPLYFLIVSSVTNIILDMLFVIVFHMGIAGVGWATLIAQTISAVLTMLLLMRTKEEYQVKLKHIRFHKHMLYEIVRLGLPSGLQNAIVSFSNVIVQSNINAFGSLAMAGCGSYTKIDGFAILPVMSYSMALTTFTGQNMGAKKYDRVKQGAKTGILMSVITIVCISALLLILGPNVLAIFSSDPTVINYGLYMMHVLAPGYIFLAISHAFNGIIRGAGITTVPMIVMVTCWCGLRMAWILTSVPLFHDIGVVFMGWPLTWIASALWLFLYYRKGSWMTRYDS